MAKIAVSGGGFYPYAMVPAFTTDETLITRAEAYTYLKQYDKAAADITSWQKSFTTHKMCIRDRRKRCPKTHCKSTLCTP